MYNISWKSPSNILEHPPKIPRSPLDPPPPQNRLIYVPIDSSRRQISEFVIYIYKPLSLASHGVTGGRPQWFSPYCRFRAASTLSDDKPKFSIVLSKSVKPGLAEQQKFRGPSAYFRSTPALLSLSQIRSKRDTKRPMSETLNSSEIRLPWHENPTCSVWAAIYCTRVENAIRSAQMTYFIAWPRC